MQEAEKYAFEPQDWGITTISIEKEDEQEDKGETDKRLIVTSDYEDDLLVLCSELKGRGYKCEIK
jgi:hypothetical protein